ncbi:hypothetical protein ACD661_12320 [Legionella lytica]|uniref:Uncharacterized protein n=1 Tax=Legionella lytica TaxID=96232 RepID=A0ABW8D9F3_9GAMM
MSISQLLEALIRIRKQIGTCPIPPQSMPVPRQHSIQEKFAAKCDLALTELTKLEESILIEYGAQGAEFLQITLHELNFPKVLQEQLNSDVKFILPCSLSGKLLPLCEMAYQNEQNGLAIDHADKLAKIFEKYQDVFDYLIKFKTQNTFEHFFHDACLFELPDVETCNFDVWKKLANTHLANPSFRALLPHATEIEVFCATGNRQKNIQTNTQAVEDKIKEIAKTSKTYKVLKTNPSPTQQATRDEELANLSMKSMQLSHELAQLCKGMSLMHCNMTILDAFYKEYQRECKDHQTLVKYGISKASIREFNQLIPRNDDVLIPNLFIKIADEGYENYYLKKLDVMDKEGAALAACLGKITHCCQYIGGAGSSCAVDGISSPHSGFYVLCRGNPNAPALSDEIIAQSWTWRSKDNALVFDSIEVNKNEPYCPIMPFFNQLTKELITQGHTHKVVCGSGSGIARYQGVIDNSASIEKCVDYTGYSDASTQRVLADVNKPFLFCKSEYQTKSLIIELLTSGTPFNENRMLHDFIYYLLCNKKNLLEFTYALLTESLRDKKAELDALIITVLSTSDFLNNISNIQWLWSTLPEKHILIFEAIKNNLPNIIKSSHDFCALFPIVSVEQQNELFNLVKKNLREMIKGDKYACAEVLTLLSKEQRAELFDLLKNDLSNLITDSYELDMLFRCLIPAQRIEVWHIMKDKLSSVLNAQGLVNALNEFSPGEIALLDKIIKEILPEIIKTRKEFNSILDLPPEKSSVVLESIKSSFPYIIKNGEQLGAVIKLLPKRHTEILEIMSASLRDLIGHCDEFIEIFKELADDNRLVFFRSLKKGVPFLINNMDDFEAMQASLSLILNEPRKTLLEVMGTHLHRTIRTHDDFIKMLTYLSPEQYDALCEQMQDSLDRIVHTTEELRAVLHHFTPVQILNICTNIQFRQPELIKTIDDFALFLTRVPQGEIYTAYKKIKFSLYGLLNSSNDLATILQPLPLASIKEICRDLGRDIPYLIQNGKDVLCVFQPLAPEQINVVGTLIKEHLLKIINNSNQFSVMITSLKPNQIIAVCGVMEKNMPRIINNKEDLIKILKPLAPEQINALCIAQKDRLLKLVKAQAILGIIRANISEEQAKALIRLVDFSSSAHNSTNNQYSFFSSGVCEMDSTSCSEASFKL